MGNDWRFRAWCFSGCWRFVVFAFPVALSAADVDESKLPPAAEAKIDFTRDIRPILENSCLRCHGPEKTKSKFRLDSRVTALKGGEKGVDILPGKSAKSPLIHYVSGLVEDMEMPPSGKGDPLAPAQVGLLRAWIDQGAAWDAGAPTNNLAFSITPIFGGTIVNGDKHKFREHYWQKEGVNGGIEQFESFEQTDPNTKVLLSGHVLLDDYKITLDVDRNEIGFIHAGWEQYRKYFDDTGGYYPFAGAPSTYSLNQDLHLDIGKAWIDFGLTLPDWPRMVLGYEYDYKNGSESLTSWGPGSPGQPGIAPVSKDIHEGVHILKFDLDHEIYGITIEERFRGEFYRLDTSHTNMDARAPVTENVSEGTTYFQGANTIRLEKQFTDWFFGSAGYLYSKLNSDANFVDVVDNGTVSIVPRITLEKESHIFNANSLLGSFHGLTLSTGVQSEWTREEGFGAGSLNRNNIPLGLTLLPPLPTTLSANYDENATTETMALRYTKIPFTVLFAEARLRQDRIGEMDSDIQPDNAPPGGNYLQDTVASSQLSDLRFGFSTSPWQAVSWSTHYRRYEVDSQYDNKADSLPPGAYPGFLLGRDVRTDEIESKLVLRPCYWFKTTLSYKYSSTDYREDTIAASGFTTSPGGDLVSGQYAYRTYAINSVLTPWRRLYLSGTFSYQPSTITTAANGAGGIVPYQGNTYSVIANATYIFNESTDLFANYSFSEADFAQNNFSGGLPVGLEYTQHSIQAGLTHRLTKNLSTKLLYGFNSYSEPSNGGALDYHSHTIFATLTFKMLQYLPSLRLHYSALGKSSATFPPQPSPLTVTMQMKTGRYAFLRSHEFGPFAY